MNRQLLTTAFAAAVLSIGATSEAGCGLFGSRDCCDPCGSGVTTYRFRPLFGGLFRARRASYGTRCCSPCATSCCSPCSTSCCSPCSSCCTTTYSVRYVAQTSYKANVCCVPVTTCQCTTCCDPCTGCPVTVRRPVTTYVRQVRYTPVTTYRAVCCPQTVCQPVCQPSCCQPSCCQPSCCPSNGYGTTGSVIMQGTTVPSTTIPSTTPMPSNGSDGLQPPQTFQGGGSSSSYRAPAAPSGSGGVNRSTSYPSSSPSDIPRNLTTSLPNRSWTFQRVSSRGVISTAAPSRRETAPAKPESKPSNTGGWRAAR